LGSIKRAREMQKLRNEDGVTGSGVGQKEIKIKWN
jgi:hypothetical protein